MASSEHHDPNELLDAYIDGRLDPGARAAFERRLGEDEALRAAVQLQSEIDTSLRRSHSIPDVDRVIGRLNGRLTPVAAASAAAAAVVTVEKRTGISKQRLGLGMSMAAAVVLAVGGTWYFSNLGGNKGEVVDWVIQKRNLTEAYDEMVRTGFKPLWECKNDHQFAATFKKRFDQGLIMAKSPDVKCLGIHYVNSITPKTTVLLVSDHERKSMVFVDRLDKDAPEFMKTCKDIKVFRREIGKAVLYEVTTQEAPHALDLISEIEVPPEWLNEYSDGTVPGAPAAARP